MNLDERIAQMRREMELRRKALEERMAAIRSGLADARPHSDNTSRPGISPLVRHQGLEDDTETKIGMFDRLYEKQYASLDVNCSRRLDYNTIDYAPLVNLLACAVEIELNAALSGVARSNGIEYKGMFGDFINVLTNRACRPALLEYVPDIQAVIKAVEKIRGMRNPVSHKDVITREAFTKFYSSCYCPFFNEILPGFILLKQNARQQKCTTHASASRCFGPDEEHSAGSNVKSRRVCLILTNTDKLSIKYYQGINIPGFNGSEQIKEGIILPYIQAARAYGVDYHLLDVAAPDCVSFLDREGSWRSHLELLDNYRATNLGNICGCPGLFILGGDDVIPMPRMRNPTDNAEKETLKQDVLEATIEADWIYGFPPQNVKIDGEGYLDFRLLSGVSPCFYVGRLPLESGLMESRIDDDLSGYLNRSLAALASDMEVNKSGAVGCHSCRIITAKMVEGLPQPDLSEMPLDYRFGNIFVSPELRFDVDEDDPTLPAVAEYVSRIKECELITLGLHGSPAPGQVAFVGEAHTSEGRVLTPVFAPFVYKDSAIRIVTAICCWGARFIGYSRNTSSLLNAFYKNNVLLYVGACRSALGAFDCHFMNEEGLFVTEPQPMWSEALMQLFLRCLGSGLPAGEALAIAKSNYLRNHSFGLNEDALTVLQFNLFGDPMLRLAPLPGMKELLASECDITASLPVFEPDSFSYRETVICKKEPVNETCIVDQSSTGLLNRVRSMVDSNLYDICQRLSEMVYTRYGIEPRTLNRIARFTTSSGQYGYRFLYREQGPYPVETSLYTSLDGTLIRIVSTL